MLNYMDYAIKEAKIAYKEGNVPVGAVIVCDGEIISSCHNTKNSSNIAVNHAEILCIIDACKYLNSWYLSNCDMYVTLKPCDMCINALAECRIRNVYFLLNSNYDNNLLQNKSKINVFKMDDSYNYAGMLNDFFSDIRR